MGAVLKGEKNLVPLGIHHGCNREGALVVFAKPGALSREFIAFQNLGTGIVVAAHLGAGTAPVEAALTVDEFAVIVQKQVVSCSLILCDFFLQGLVSSLGFIRGIVRIAVVHTLGPPAEEEEGVAAYAPAGLVHFSVKVAVTEEPFSVLMFENNPLPALHAKHPPGSIAMIPPSIRPPAVYTGSNVPGAGIRSNHVSVAFPAFAAKTMGVLEETELQSTEPAVFFVNAHAVPGVLESGVVRAKVQPLILPEQAEAIHEHLGAVLDVLLAEDLFRLFVGGIR